MIKNIGVGIDLGSETTRVVVGEFVTGEKNPKIIGAGEAESIGMRHGYVSDSNSVINSLKTALHQAEKTSGIKIRRAFLSVSGLSLRSETASGEAIISKANGEVTTLDINRAVEDSENNLSLNNRKVIQVYPLSFRLDGKDVHGRLEGMRGTKLEVKTLFLTYSALHLEDLINVVARAGVEVIDVIASPIALANLVLTEKQKIVGVALVNIGAETTSLSVFENGFLIYMHTFSIGSSDITNDIALGFKIPLEKAESLKQSGSVSVHSSGKEEYSRKKLDEIIEARLADIFESIENNLKKIKRAELLPAGIVFTGGGANISKLEEHSKSMLKLPSTVGSSEIFGNSKTKLRDPAWYNVIGLLISSGGESDYSENSLGGLFKNLKGLMKSSLKQLMP